jgi:catechol 2,3-dioxygenase-like lactoylglutathione lyase family enzyme
MPPHILEQQVTFLYTRDLPTTADFYERIIGLPMVLDQGTCRIYRVTPTAFVGFCTRANANRDSRDVIFTLVTPQVDEWHAHLLAAGVTIEKPPTFNADYNIYHIFILDPNGYKIEFQEFRDPAWVRAGKA